MEEPVLEEKGELLNRYRTMFVDKLTIADLQELRFYVTNMVDSDHRINPVCRQKLEFRLRQYFHEEILKREMAGIETLLMMLRPEDLQKSAGVRDVLRENISGEQQE